MNWKMKIRFKISQYSFIKYFEFGDTNELITFNDIIVNFQLKSRTMVNNTLKFSKFLFVFVIISVLTSLSLFAQGNSTSIDFQAGFATLTSFVIVIPIVVEFIKKIIPKNSSSLVIQIISWITGVILAMLAWFLNIGFFAELVLWWEALAVGIGASLVANGIFDTGLITWILSIVGIKTIRKS